MSDRETKIIWITGSLNPSDGGALYTDSVATVQSIMYHRPYSRSEPCQTPPRLDPIWSAPLPPPPALAKLNENNDASFNTAPIAMLHKPGLASRRYRLDANGRWHNLHPQPVCQPSCKEPSSKSKRPRLSWWKQVMMAPVDGIIW